MVAPGVLAVLAAPPAGVLGVADWQLLRLSLLLSVRQPSSAVGAERLGAASPCTQLLAVTAWCCYYTYLILTIAACINEWIQLETEQHVLVGCASKLESFDKLLRHNLAELLEHVVQA